MAWSDEPWIVEGAAVRVCDCRSGRWLGGGACAGRRAVVGEIQQQPDQLELTSRKAVRVLRENRGVILPWATSRLGPFDVSGDSRLVEMLRATDERQRPDQRRCRCAVGQRDGHHPKRTRGMFIIDFGTTMTEGEAAAYEVALRIHRGARPASSFREQAEETPGALVAAW